MPPEEKTYRDLQDALREPDKVRRLNLSKQALEDIPAAVFSLPRRNTSI